MEWCHFTVNSLDKQERAIQIRSKIRSVFNYTCSTTTEYVLVTLCYRNIWKELQKQFWRNLNHKLWKPDLKRQQTNIKQHIKLHDYRVSNGHGPKANMQRNHGHWNSFRSFHYLSFPLSLKTLQGIAAKWNATDYSCEHHNCRRYITLYLRRQKAFTQHERSSYSDHWASIVRQMKRHVTANGKHFLLSTTAHFQHLSIFKNHESLMQVR